ncbi:MAG TPA: UDP-N-acetylmuramoyl-tripeptide--D-alanyl-D-alanine ligase [Thermoleophilaceae bacterium]|nr:UDP-N-acetylmuramoyl-tripeptide--D-alanyl-D-alanine ligase [Thermoleophilaceae bacterium]
MIAVGLISAALGLLALIAGRLHFMLHLFQLEHYEAARLRVWVRRRNARVDRVLLGAVAVAGALLIVLAAADADVAVLIVGVAAGVVLAGFGHRIIRRPQTKPLVFTARARRLFIAALVIPMLVLLLAAIAVVAGAPSWVAAAIGTATGLIGVVAAPELLFAGDVAVRPVQELDNRRFVRRARQRLGEIDPLVVGITGSFGKTTTKVCTAAVAELRGPAYATPASYNTYLGVVRAINEGLSARHRTLIAEMGAYRLGDVAELCNLVHPRIGVLTAIGPAHLERFGSLDAIEQAKGELAEGLPEYGTYVTTVDDERCLRTTERTQARVLLFSAAGSEEADLWAEGIEMAEGTTRFTLRRRIRDGGTARGAADAGTEDAVVRSKLLGRHNVANLLAAAAVGTALDLPLDAIARSLSRVTPPAHRLAPILNRQAGIVVIDDAYNSNPVGAAAALEVLASHAAERRVLVTPGMVELGDREAEENERFGAQAAAVCDLVVLVGDQRSRPIRAGLSSADFPDDRIHVVANSSEAEALLAKTTRRGDVVLFENDLPDLYAEDGAAAARH